MKKIGIIVVLLVSTLCVTVQGRTPAYVDLELGGGAVVMPYGGFDNGLVAGGNFDFGAKYAILFNPRKGWGMSFGAGLSTFQGTRVLNGEYEYPSIDSEGENDRLNTKIQNWTERQQVYSAAIPVSVFYQHKRYRKSGWFGSFGLKLYIPFHASYNVTQGDIITKGWYEAYGGQIWRDDLQRYGMWLYDLPQHGYGMYNSILPSGKIETSLLVTAQLQFGAILHLDKKKEMYVAGYIEHGANNMFVNKDAKPLFTTIQNVNSYQYNGYYSSLSTNSIPIIVGIKVGWRFKDVHDCNCIRQ